METLIPALAHHGHGQSSPGLARVFGGTITRVELEVFASNTAALALYEREGFVREGRKRQARHLDGTSDDLLILACLREEWPALPNNNPGTEATRRTPS